MNASDCMTYRRLVRPVPKPLQLSRVGEQLLQDLGLVLRKIYTAGEYCHYTGARFFISGTTPCMNACYS